jgi:ATP-dependent DNA helicase PIF1
MKLNPEQEYAFAQVQSGKNIFLTGSGGTGKSYVIHRIREWCISENIPLLITAMTGSAALLIDGMTLHSALGLRVGDLSASQQLQHIQKFANIRTRIQTIRMLIIDEVSMLNASLLETIDIILRTIRGCLFLPFGGIQVVLCGDLLQLPPVEGKYCFESPMWKELIGETCMLHTMVRQTGDPYFQTMLTDIRMGCMKQEYIRRLEQCKRTVFPPNVKPTLLYSTRANVQQINHTEYSKLLTKGSKSRTYNTVYKCPSSKVWADSMGIPEHLELCIGSQVAITYNIDQERGMINGTRGVVVDLLEEHPIIQLISGEVIPLTRIKREIYDTDTMSDKKTPYGVQYIPLMFAWAMTIHKSQGMTLDAVVIDLGPSIFSYGQAYTAISRVRNLQSLLITDLYPSSFRADKKVLAFYQNGIISTDTSTDTIVSSKVGYSSIVRSSQTASGIKRMTNLHKWLVPTKSK